MSKHITHSRIDYPRRGEGELRSGSSGLAGMDTLAVPAAKPAQFSSPTPAPPSACELVDGRYRLVCELGKGGMGVVFLAYDTSLGRKVALKFLHAGAGPHDRKSFEHEATVLARVINRYVVSVYDVGEHAGCPYFVMQYVEGITLADYLDQAKGGLPVDVALGFAAQICEAVDSVHCLGLIHRDIKPSNVMISGGTEAMLMDFGIAQENVGRTRGTISGTPHYLAPEEARGEPLTGDDARRSDIYSLGVTLYELIAGRPPFIDDDSMKALARQIREAPPLLSDLRPDVPPAVERVIMRALEKNPALRPASCQELMDALLAARDVAAHGVSSPESTALITDAGPAIVECVQAALAATTIHPMVHSGVELFETLRLLRPACIVVDLDLMTEDPRELIARLRSDSVASLARLVALGEVQSLAEEAFFARLGVERLRPDATTRNCEYISPAEGHTESRRC